VLSQVLLDDYEKGMTSARLDKIFQEVGCVAHIGFVKAFIMRKWVTHQTLLLCMY
jgi:Zn-dependent M32 family carboxypeptidase